MHEAAHGGIHGNKAINEWVGQWLCAVPVGADLASYRSYHLQHHKFTQQPEDPDLSLSAPFPISKDSYHPQGDPRPHRPDFRQTAAAAVPVAVPARRCRRADVARELCLQRRRQDGAVSRRECADVRPVLAGRRGHLVFRRLGVGDGDLAAAGDAHPQYRRARLHLDRRRPVQPRPHHARESDRAAVDRALLGELPRRAPSVHVSAVLPAARGASAAGRKRPDQADGSAPRLSRRDAACDLTAESDALRATGDHPASCGADALERFTA